VYRIERRPWGVWLAFSGRMSDGEIQDWMRESREVLEEIPRPFSVVVDLRALSPLVPEVQFLLVEGQRLYRERGMVRSAVLLEGPIVLRQFQRIAEQSGIRDGERYIDASRHPDPEALAIAWARDGTDPDDYDPPGR